MPDAGQEPVPERTAALSDRVADLVEAALELPPERRADFLDQACADEALRAEVDALLSHQAGADGFLEAVAFSLVGGPAGGADARDPDDPARTTHGELRPGDVLGDCRIERLLGEGGMGEVYLAEDTRLERPVALKLLKRSGHDWSLLRRFRHERRVLAGLNHPNIARLYGGATTAQGRCYLVMEYVEGERLDVYCRQRALDVPARLALFRKVCAAVTYAHQNLVVHRDLKPANIRVTPEGEPKLLDFGIAKLLEPDTGAGIGGGVGAQAGRELTVTQYAALTPEYASPEQVRGEPITTATDVYSLGVILYELLTGQRPHGLKNLRPDELVRAICEQDPPRPSTVAGRRALLPTGGPTPGEAAAKLRRRLAGDIDNIVALALRKEPARRYVSVAQFSEDLRRHGDGLPVVARKDTWAYRTGKFVGRNKVVVAATALAVLGLVGGLAAATRQTRVARRERDQARRAQAAAEDARRQTAAAKRQADRLNAFLLELLGSADPARMGKDVKVVQVLDAAGQKLDGELADEPEILAQAHDTLCRVYDQLGRFEPAERHARAALEALRRRHRPDEPAVLRAGRRLGSMLNQRYGFAEAEPLLRGNLALLRAQRTPDDFELAETLGELGFTLMASGRAPQAEPLVQEAVARMRATRGEASPDYRGMLILLGTLQFARKDYGAAAVAFRRTVALYDQFSPGDPGVLSPLLNLCICLFNQEKTAETEAAADRLERDSRRLAGEDSLWYAFSVYAHGVLAFTRGDYPAAAAGLRQVLPALTAVYPPGQTTVVQARALLGLALTRTGHAAEGEPLLRAALADGKGVDRQDFAHTCGNLETALGECLLAQARHEEAEPLLLAGYDDLRRRLGDGQALTVAAARRLREGYLAWGKPERAAAFR